MTTNNLKAQIHIAKKQLNMDDDTYRAVLKRSTGVSSCADMSLSQLHQAIHELKQLGFKVASRKNGPKSRKSQTKDGYTYKRKSQGDKIRALWITMAEQGAVKDPSEVALRNYIRRMTKGRFSAPQFCDPLTATRIIESLKKWQQRALESE